MMELNVQVEKPSNTLRKLTIRVPAKVVANRFERGLMEVQRTARLKGFRPGQAPLSVIKQYYGNDVKHQVFHNIIDESFAEAIRGQQLRAIGQPRIETPHNKTGEGAHDHTLHEDQDLTYIATVEVLPDLEVKDYFGVSLKRETVKITDDDVEKVVANLIDSQSQLVPVTGGLTMPDGSQSSRPVQNGDFVDLAFSGGVVNEDGSVEEKPGMKGSRVLEVGSNSLIPGFEENLVGMRRGETKTFRVKFPDDFYEAELAGEESEFTATINEVKEKKVPALDEEFAKQMGYESVDDLRAKAREFLLRNRTEETDRKLRSDLLQTLIERNPFEVPQVLVESQTRSLAQEMAQELKQQGYNDQLIKEGITQELDNLRKRAENQVRASLILETIAKKESIEIREEDFERELEGSAAGMRVEPEKLREFYAKNPERRDDFLFRMRQERTLSFLLDKAKIGAA
jgi:trigger factor